MNELIQTISDEFGALREVCDRLIEALLDAYAFMRQVCVETYNRLVALGCMLRAAGGVCRPLEPAYPMLQHREWAPTPRRRFLL